MAEKMKRDPRLMDQYKRAQKRIASLSPGTEAYDRNYKLLQDIGGKYGLKWQQWIPGGVSTGTKSFLQQPLSEQDRILAGQTGNVINQMAGEVQPFRPGSFQEQMDAAYNNVYDQFNRRNQAEFARQTQDFDQMAADRGLDPNSAAYKTLSKQLYDRQDVARQEAQSAALQASYGVQQQGFEQAAKTSLMPGEIAGQFAPVWGQMYQGRSAMELARLEAQWRMKLQKQADAAALQRARFGGGGGQQGPSPYELMLERQLMEGYPSGDGSNLGNAALGGFAQGVGSGLINAMK